MRKSAIITNIGLIIFLVSFILERTGLGIKIGLVINTLITIGIVGAIVAISGTLLWFKESYKK